MKFLLKNSAEKPGISHFSRIGCAGALMFLASAPWAVASSYLFTFNGDTGINATGIIDIVGGVGQSDSTINVVNVPLEANPSITTTAAGNLVPLSGDIRNFDGDVLTIDTVANPPPSNPIFDGTGVGFASSIINGNYSSAPASYDGGTPVYDTIINIWGTGPGRYGMFIGEANPADLNPDGTLISGRDAQWVYVYTENGTLTTHPVPEPSTDALILCALTGGLVAYRRRATA